MYCNTILNLRKLLALFIFFSIILNVFGQTLDGNTLQLIPFRVKDKWGLADTTGKLIIQPIYDEALFLNEQGYIKVRKGKKWGILDPNGKKVTSVKYAEVNDHGLTGYFTVYRKRNI